MTSHKFCDAKFKGVSHFSKAKGGGGGLIFGQICLTSFLNALLPFFQYCLGRGLLEMAIEYNSNLVASQFGKHLLLYNTRGQNRSTVAEWASQ